MNISLGVTSDSITIPLSIESTIYTSPTEEKSINPSRTAQIITPSNGKLLSQVTVGRIQDGIVIPQVTVERSGSCTGITGVSHNLFLESTIIYSMIFRHSSGTNLNDYTISVTVDGTSFQNYTLEDKPTGYGVNIPLDLKDLDKQCVASITDTSSNTYIFTSTPLLYLYNGFNNADYQINRPKFVEMCGAIYYAHLCSKEWFEWLAQQ